MVGGVGDLYRNGDGKMPPVINLNETGRKLQKIMRVRGITPKDVIEYLNLTSVQSVYNWFYGNNMPSIDNLYALSELLEVPIDDMICGNRKEITQRYEWVPNDMREQRMYSYYKKLNSVNVA